MKPIFSKLGTLNEQDIEWISDQGTKIQLVSDSVLIQEGECLNNLFILLTGTLSVYVSQQSEQDQKPSEYKIARITPGELVGEISFVDRLPTLATVKVDQDAIILSLSWQQMASKVQEDMGFAARFYQSLCILLSERMREISSLLISGKILSTPPLRKILFVFGILNDIDIDWMNVNGRFLEFSPGKVLIKQGEEVDSLYILLDGTLTIAIEIEENSIEISKEVAQLKKGEIIGEISFVEKRKASASVFVAEKSHLLAIPQEKLRAKLQQDMGFAYRFYRAITVVITDRFRERIIRRGYSQIAYFQSQSLTQEIEDDELDIETLEKTSLAATRFDWLAKRVRSNY